jgi:intracellular multiplication protein IcmQ
MVAINHERELDHELIKILDQMIEEGKWESSLFLQATVSELRKMRENFATELNVHESQQETQHADAMAQQKSSEDLTEVYMALYAANGKDIKRWEQVLNSLTRHSVSRPIYKTEEDVKDVIRAKDLSVNDAYIAIYIHKTDIIPPPNDKIPQDRYGHGLLVLRHGAIRIENITRFIHDSGVYTFKGGMLIKM